MKFFYFFLILFSVFVSAQDLDLELKKDTTRKSLREAPKQNPRAAFNQYRIVSLKKDTIYIDTSLTIQKEYNFNFLRKDIFGLLSLHNDAQPLNILDFNLKTQQVLPQFGFLAKHFNYQLPHEVHYYSVATPFTELYFKTVLEQGQSLDAFITLNTSEQFNFSIGYKGLRSLGKYLNSLASSGTFKITSNYHTKNKRYIAFFHLLANDLLNQENGGLLTKSQFTSNDSDFNDRARVDVLLPDAESVLKGKRFFLNHEFFLNPKSLKNKVALSHEIWHESKFFEFNKNAKTNYFGSNFSNGSINNRWNNKSLYNKISANFTESILGNFNFFIENFNTAQFYNRALYSNNLQIPNLIEYNLTSIGANYFYKTKKIQTSFLILKSVSKQSLSVIEANATYSINSKNKISAVYSNKSKVPNLNYTLFQSDFLNYNWKNSFQNEKINSLQLQAQTQWFQAEANIKSLDNHLYFSNNSTIDTLFLVTPKQYTKTINYLSIKASKEIKYKKWALDNTFLYQEVSQENAILNVPKFTVRNSLYYSNNVFKKAMFIQTGIIFQSFSKYYANEYSPILGEFYIQSKTKIGNYPLADLFINARVRQTRIYFKAEHVNALFSKNNYFATPNQPYRDFVVRFGLVWNFFQ